MTNHAELKSRRWHSLRGLRILRRCHCVALMITAILLVATYQLYIGIYKIQTVPSRHKHHNWLTSVLAQRFAKVQQPHFTVFNKQFSGNVANADREILSATNANFSSFRIINNQGLPYQLCDHLEVAIETRDSLNQIKKHGGDFLFAWLEDVERKASVGADEILDHHNGTYTAKFTLHWSGKTKVSVLLIHASESVSALRNERDRHPVRFTYKGMFKNGTRDVTSPCNVSPDMYLLPVEINAQNVFCNLTDKSTGFPWYCLKPSDALCDSYYLHSAALERANGYYRRIKTVSERRIYKRKPAFIRSHTGDVIIVNSSTQQQQVSVCQAVSQQLPPCKPGLHSKPNDTVAGFYFQGSWHYLVCQNRHRDFTSEAEVRTCLSNHRMYLFGDSTLRQWYFHLAGFFNETISESRGNHYIGPHFAVDDTFKFNMAYYFHGLPVRVPVWVNATDLQYIPNVLDGMQLDGDDADNVIIVLSLWAHFTSTNLKFYQKRWKSIKTSLLSFRTRYPRTRFFIKSANTREPKYDLSNWFAWELDKVMRREMSKFSNFVTIIDTWDMTIGHHTGYDVHPADEVVAQQVSMMLSFLCADDVVNDSSSR